MDLFEPQLVVKKEVRFTEAFTESTSNGDENFGDVFGGIIKSGQWSWLTKGSRLHIMSIRTGQLIMKFDFDDSNGFGVCIITCVSEVNLPFVPDAIIAIGLQYVESPGGIIVLYSVEESTVLRCIELKHKITCCKFLSHEVSQHCVMQNMSGCLAVGTDRGNVLLVDLNLRGDEVNSALMDSGVSVVPCHIVDHNMSLLHLQRHFQHCQQEGVHFGIQLEAPENAEFVQSLLPIDIILGLAAGLGDGRLVLYDLTDMLIFFVVPPQERSSPLVKMSFMEPPDDPRPCVYIWAFHENSQNSKAVLHSLMYEKRVVTDDGFCYFENFQVSSVRLLLPLNSPKSVPVTCQTIFKSPSHGNDETISLCALVWKHEKEKQAEVLLFDINQWYKEEMPYVGDWRDEPSYLASFVLPRMNIIEFFFNPKTTSLFNSIQRSEEHFYPVSLSFDCVALGETGCVHLNWPGVQNRVINVLRSKGSLALLDPNPIFLEILNTRLLPQFSKLNYNSTFSLKAKRETLLSVALEQNCIGLLKECAKNWSDGSHQGTSLLEALSLSTLTDWMWSRASSIKERCNKLCQVLFDHSGCVLDQREQKELGYISKQLKTLADLLGEITTKYKETIPSDVLNTLQTQAKSIQLASDYQEILLWLLNIGLLPEASRPTKYREIELNLVPYPYESLQRFYTTRRKDFTRLNEKFASRKTGSCFLLFIDSFIEHEFKGNSLRDSWQETGGDGLYPPTSIQAMLRTMLSPDVSFDNKCALFLYFFLDLNMAIEDKRYEPIVQNFIKFPSVFRLSASLIKQIQAFWNLDHCRFPAAVDEFISPFNKDHVCPQWQLELFIESLLAQSEANLALRVLEAKSSPISPVLQLNTYLANDLISEAFHFARSKQDEDLLKLFFTGCLCTGKFGVIRDLALTESEGALVQSILKNSKSRNAENLHFVYLLQKYKYIEAVSYLDELSKGRVAQRAVDVDTPTLVLSAYNATMTPVTKGLSDVYFKIKNKIKSREAEQNSPYPLSCQLIKQNANDLLGGIYHSSALSTHFASQYWERHHSEANALQQSKNAPFLRRPQVQASYADIRKKNISYPDPYEAAQKRRLDQNSADEDRSSKVRENPRKRRKMYDLSNLEAIYKPLRELSSTESMMTSTKSESRQVRSQTKYAKSPPGDTSLLLETPYFKKTTEDNPDSGEGVGSEKPAISLHGILKGTQKSPTEDTELARGISAESDRKEKKEAEEEKSIRFVLPTIEDESDEQMDVQESKTDDSEERDQMEQPSLRRYSGPSKRKALRSTPSAVQVEGRKSSLRNSSSLEPEQELPRKSVKKAVYVEEDSGDSFINQSSMSVVAEKNSLVQDSKYVAAEMECIPEKEPASTEAAEKEQPRALKVTLSRPAIVRSRTPLRASIATESKVLPEAPEASEAPKAFYKASASLGTVSSSVSLPLRATKAAESKEELPEAPKVFFKPSVGVDKVTTSVSLTRTSVRQTLEQVKKDDFAEQRPEEKTSTPDDSTANVRIIPIVIIDESPTDKELDTTATAVTLMKNPKRALSESSDDQATESLQRSAKQLKGRVSIHSSSSEGGENKVPTTTTDLKDPAKSIFLRTETMIGFEPQVSSSRVCATESRFRFAAGDSLKTSVTTEKKISRETFAEQSTVVGGLTYLPTLEASEQVTETISVAVPTGQRMMDTTIDMTMYDTMTFEHSNPPPSSESSSSADAPSDGRYMDEEEEYTNSEFNACNEYEPHSKQENDDNDSVILLSSRSSSSSTFYGDAMEDGKATTTTTRHIIIDDEDDDSDGVDIIERYSAGSDPSNSYSNHFSEVTRTSTSCSLGSTSIAIDDVENTTSIASYKEVETGEDYEESSKDYDSRDMAPIHEEEVMETLTVEEDSEDNEESKEAPPKAVVVPVNENEIVSSEREQEEIKDTQPEIEVITLVSPETTAEVVEQSEDEHVESVSCTAEVMEQNKDQQVESVSDVLAESAESSSAKEAVVFEAAAPEKVVDTVAKAKMPEEVPKIQSDAITSETENPEAVTGKVKESETPIIEEEKEKLDETQAVTEETEKNLEKMDETENVEKEIPSIEVVEAAADPSTPNETEESHTPKAGRRRSSSFSKANTTASDIADSPYNRRNSRGGSMPPSAASQIVTRRRSMLLEKLEEHPTPDSPSSRTRSRLRADSVDGELESPSVSSVKRTRLSSISSVTSVDNPQTPKSRRRSSMSVDKEVITTPKTPRTARGKSATAEEASTPIKTPRRLSISKREKTSPNQSIIEDESQENPDKGPEPTRTAEFMASRRLTRTQLATLEKSAALEKQFSQSPVRATRRSTSRASEKESPPDVKGSDTESISSRTSHLSNASRRITRSSALKENVEDDVGSIASSTDSGKRRKKRGKEATSPIALSAIPEEDPSGSEKSLPISESSKKSRRQKK